MSTPTAARPNSSKSAHWYSVDGQACYEVPKADGKGTRKTTLADARKRNLLPSVTGIVDLLHKEQLVNWKIEQAALAVLTAPKLEGECGPECPQCHERVLKLVDKFVVRVLHTEAQQDQEAKIARDKGTLGHDALTAYFQGQPVTDEMLPYIQPAFEKVWAAGEYVTSEKILVGNGYAGMTDLVQNCPEFWKLSDFKFTGKLPDKGAWPEHRLQLSAYAKALQRMLREAGEVDRPIVCSNVYISTKEIGKFVEWQHDQWEKTYLYGFAPLVTHWQWVTGHIPEQPEYLEQEEPPVEEVAEQPAAPAGTAEPAAPQVDATLHKSGKHVVWSPGMRVQ